MASKNEYKPDFLLLISCLQVLCFIIDQLTDENTFLATSLHYTPSKKTQIWRLVTYVLVHWKLRTLVADLALQFIAGYVLEIEIGRMKTAKIYAIGTLAASISTSLSSKRKTLMGANGPICAMAAAQIVYILKKRNVDRDFMKSRRVTLSTALCLICYHIFIISWNCYLGLNSINTYVAHIAGYVAGFKLGYDLIDDRLIDLIAKFIAYLLRY